MRPFFLHEQRYNVDMVEPERITRLNNKDRRSGAYILYWMQASQRVACNHALEYAVSLANERKEPLVVYFGLTDGYPEANLRHYRFMLEGLLETRQALLDRGIAFVARHESPEDGVVKLSKEAFALVCDRGYLRFQEEWRRRVAEQADCAVVQVETDAVVPVETASNHKEYSAATLRRKLVPQLPAYLVPVEEQAARIDAAGMKLDGIDITDIDNVLGTMDIDESVQPVTGFRGGTSGAMSRLQNFVDNKMDHYAGMRNDPDSEVQSDLSPYLHFGQISPLAAALEVNRYGGEGADAFLEELIVRRELAINFVNYNPAYDSFMGLPAWSLKTLREHTLDPREHIYSLQELEEARTGDRYWNAAQREMTLKGKMHGYMRMYWGKRLLEWTESPEDAFRYALYFNNKYELDGRDPNSYAGIAWCFGEHDRPWKTRPVFGSVRYMNANGLRRKFDIEHYADRFLGST